MIDPTEYPAFDFGIDSWHDGQMFCDGNDIWEVTTLWEAARDLPIYEVPVVALSSDLTLWDTAGDNFHEFCRHALLINNADLSYPIILTPAGVIADGRHRLAKALITGETTLHIQRLVTMPEPDYVVDADGDVIDN